VLFERLGAGAGPVVVSDLRLDESAAASPSNATVAIPAMRPAKADELSYGDMDGAEDLALASLGPLEPMPASRGGDLLTALESALAGGRYQDAVTLANSDPAAVSKDEPLRRLAAKAQEHAESDPYVRRFLDQAREAIQGGRESEVDKLVAKASSLNPEHPGLIEIEEMRRNYAGAAPMGGRRRGIDLEPEAEDSLPPLGVPGDEDIGELTLEDEEGLPGGLQLLDDEPAAPAGAAPMTSGAGESDRRIAELLDEGQQAHDRGEHQAAIDAWSRIFLIDIDHSEAARRIEQARKLKAESERQVEEIFHEGAAHLDAGDLEPAKAAFKKVLELQPGHLAAREMLQRAEAPPSTARRPSMAPADAAPALAIAPAAPARAAAPRERSVAPSARPAPAVQGPAPKRTFLYLGGAVLVLALGGGAFLWLNRDRFFPNRGAAPPPAQAAATADPIARATKLHDEGKAAVAIAQLRRLPPEDPQYDRAQALIQQWEAATAPAAPSLSGAEVAHRSQLVEDARRAYQERRYLRAELMFEQAAAISPLDATAAELLADSKRQLAPYADQIALFKQGDWEFVLPTLWRLREANADNLDIERLIVDAYYNLAVRDLQREDPRGAAEKLKEAVQLAPEDAEVRRLASFANVYRERQQDLLYRVFVKYLAFR
jgi:tetratricopeptide (TPR) repeat protein